MFFRPKKKPNMFYMFLFYITKNGFQELLPNWLHFFLLFKVDDAFSIETGLELDGIVGPVR